MDIKIIRSKRKTLAVQVGSGGVVVRAPLRATDEEIDKFIAGHESWIEKHYQKVTESRKEIDNSEPLTYRDINELADKALKVIPERVEYYAKKIGVTYGKITIRSQKSRWGSCSSTGNLNFNCLLMLTPPEVIDSVVVHELCHRKEMNHSERFYAEVLRVYPDYKKWDKWLKTNGKVLIGRMEKGKDTDSCPAYNA